MGRNNSERYQHAILEETIAPSVNDANADTKVILDLLRFLATDANSPDIGRIDRHALAAFLRKPTLSIPEQWQPLWPEIVTVVSESLNRFLNDNIF